MSARTCANCSRPIRMSNGRWWHPETGLERCAMEFWAIPVDVPSGESARCIWRDGQMATYRHLLPVGRFADTMSGVTS